MEEIKHFRNMQIVSPRTKSPMPSTTHTEKPVTPQGGLRSGEVRPDPFCLHGSVTFCPRNHHFLLWPERAGEGATDTAGPSTANGSYPAACFWLGKLRDDWAREARGKPELWQERGRFTSEPRENTSPSPWQARRLLSRGCAGKLGPAGAAIAEAGAAAGPQPDCSLYFGLCLELSIFF